MSSTIMVQSGIQILSLTEMACFCGLKFMISTRPWHVLRPWESRSSCPATAIHHQAMVARTIGSVGYATLKVTLLFWPARTDRRPKPDEETSALSHGYINKHDTNRALQSWPVLIRPRLAGFEVTGDTTCKPVQESKFVALSPPQKQIWPSNAELRRWDWCQPCPVVLGSFPRI
jgi:hypothetical protein